MGGTQLWSVLSTQFQVPAEWDLLHPAGPCVPVGEQVFLGSTWYPLKLHISNKGFPEPFWEPS